MRPTLIILAIVLLSVACKKDEVEPTPQSDNTEYSSNTGLGVTQPVWDGFFIDLMVVDSLGNPMDSVLIEGLDFPYNGRQCGNAPFYTDNTGHCNVCVMYGHAYGSPSDPPDSQKFELNQYGWINEFQVEVLLYDTIDYTHYFE